ncbi:YceI family protein [Noviherbaspirillum massiliense]|uniref:YceI family protein n=1 Tax=Noviherbaspirillum massiliense TaxID=1465823 RepID=UPI0003034CD6|nr:YceI family protein [Noviherbaspirillum massiliense]
MQIHSIRRSIILGSAALALAIPAIAAMLKTDAAKSSVSAVFQQMNVPVEGKFRKFNAQIDFDNAKPEGSKAMVEIDVASFDLGDPEYNKEVQKKEWFDAARFPKASFVSSMLKPNGAGKFDVVGKLTIKGKTADVRFPLTLKKEGGNQVFEGTLPIKRLAFNIGEGEWKDTGMVADEVLIKFRVVTTQ